MARRWGHGLTAGCAATVPARYFDVDEEVPWSEAEFGEKADETRLQVVVQRLVRDKIRVLVDYDQTSYVLPPTVLTHDPLTCPNCRSQSSDRDPINDPEPAAPPHRVTVAHGGPSAEGADGPF